MKRIFTLNIILLLTTFLFTSCAQKEDTHYQKEIKEWHTKRIENLTKPTGWLSLAGLYWLSEGDNTFGTGTSNKIIFKDVKAPEVIGKYVKNGDDIIFISTSGVKVTSDSNIVTETKIKADVSGKPTILELGTLSWYIIKRGEKYGIRLRDTANPNITGFKGIEMFDIDPAWRVAAKYVAFDEPKKITIPNILGQIEEEDSYGELRFKIDNKEYSLVTTGTETPYFIIFNDETNGNETYGAGRFLVIEGADSTGNTFIDFNKAYNPPCAFTKYATCPIPPKENMLHAEITAGEKNYHGAGH
jgi:uncharacterized protein